MADAPLNLSAIDLSSVDLSTLRPEQKRALLVELLARKATDSPLSLNQRSLWFLEQLNPGRPIYHIHTAFRLEGDLDPAALEASLAETIRRHESMRTTFGVENGEPRQRVTRNEPAKLPLEILPDMTPAERDEALDRLTKEEALRPLDLERGPLWALRLVRLAPQQHVLFLKMHHIISDGWSLGVLLRELTALYPAFRDGKPSPLPPLTAQYRDYVKWQKEREASGGLERDLVYWRQKLAGHAEALDIPTRGPRPALQTYRGGHRGTFLAQELVASARALGRTERTTLFVVLLAAFKAILARHARQSDVIVGSPVANRLKPEFAALIGYFSNMIVLRDEVTNDLSFRELVRRVRQTVQDALSRQDVPLERLVQEVKPRRDPSRHPLFQAVFVLQAELTELRKELPGVVMSPFKQRNEETKFDLQMSANPTLDGFRLTLGYNRDLFDGDSIERITDHMRVFLARALASPDVPLGEISLLEDGERTELVVRRNQTQKAFDGPGCVHQLFERQVALRPDASAVEHDDRKVTYRELNTLADRIAARLRVEGVTTDRPVGVILERSIEMVAAFLGVLKSGGAYLPLDPLLPASRLELHLTDAAPTVVLANRRTAGRLASLPSSPRVLLVEDLLGDEAAPLDPAFAESATPGAPSDMAYILYTSGSTGRPKGVAVEHRSVVNYIHAASEVYKLTSSDRVLQFASSAHDAHVEEIYPCLAAGATLVLRTDEMLDSYQDFLVGCQTTGVSVVSLPTAYWHELTAAIVDHGLRRLPSAMRLVILGGERAWSERVSQWFDQIGDRVALVNTYGPTEATVIATACRVVDPRDPEGGVRRVPIGAPIANVRTYVLDEAQRPVPIGVPGELYIGGDCLARGYLGRPDLTAERFVPDPFSDVPGARMYRTGDLVRWLPDGLLDFLGRTDGQVKIRGFRIEPGEVEAALSAHPGVAQAAVVALPDGDEFRLVGYVATHDANGPAPLELRRYLEGQLPHYLVPSVICRLPSLPTNAAGKIDRAALPAPEAAAEGREIAEAPQSPEEEQIAAVFCETLRVERVGRHENFFDLGGHSLLAVQLLSKLRTRLNVELRLNDLLMGPTVAQIAETIKNPHADSRSLHPALGALTGDDSPNEKPSSDASKTPGATKAAAPAGNANNVGRMLFGAPAPEPVVTLRPGDRWRPPIVLWPGLGGRVEGFKQLADWLAPGHPIVGIQARGLDGIEAPHRTMGESIEWGLQALAEAGYESPLVVGGMSMGGLNALEMSRRLRATGRPPQLTLLLDTQLPMGSGFTGDMPSVGDDEVFGRLAKWLNLDVAPLLSVAEGDRWSSLLKRGQAAGVIPAEVTLEQLKGLGAVCRCQLEGLASYELQSDPGAVLLIQAVQDKHGQTSQTGAVAVAKWQKIFPNFSVYRVPTYHVGVLQPPHVKAIARQVNVILQTAPSGVAGREGATS